MKTVRKKFALDRCPIFKLKPLLVYLKKVSRRAWNITWTVSIKNLDLEELKLLKQYSSINLDESWLIKEQVEGKNLEIFGETNQYLKDLVTKINNSSNYIKIKAMEFMEKIDSESVVNLTIKNNTF